jgi:ferredoxin
MNACTACHLCVSACPTHVIKPSLLEYGLAGFMQPRMDYKASYCNFDCVICTEVCPTGALTPLTLEEKHVLQLGKVVFVKENCIVHTEGTDCGACSEHCPTKAVDMRPYRKTLFLPEVYPDICVGCGACEYACPTDPKSIYVEGNAVHLLAEKPELKPLEQPDEEEDFPF